MADHPQSTRATIIPAMRHQDAAAAIDKDEDSGGRLYSCRDPEGHGNFGTYDPWTEHS